MPDHFLPRDIHLHDPYGMPYQAPITILLPNAHAIHCKRTPDNAFTVRTLRPSGTGHDMEKAFLEEQPVTEIIDMDHPHWHSPNAPQTLEEIAELANILSTLPPLQYKETRYHKFVLQMNTKNWNPNEDLRINITQAWKDPINPHTGEPIRKVGGWSNDHE